MKMIAARGRIRSVLHTGFAALALITTATSEPVIAQESESESAAKLSEQDVVARMAQFEQQIIDAQINEDLRLSARLAREQYDLVVANLGEDHIYAIGARLALVDANVAAGYLPAAQARSEGILDTLVERYGENHLFVGIANDSIGSFYLAQGNPNKAVPRFAQAIAVFDKIYNPLAPESLQARRNYIESLIATGRSAEAVPLIEEAMELLRGAGEEQTPFMALFEATMGVAYFQQGKNDEALQYTRSALKKLNEMFGPDHFKTLGVLHNAAVLLAYLGYYEEAKGAFYKVLAGFEKKLGPGHPNSVTALHSYALILEKTGDTERAIELAKLSMQNAWRIYRDEHVVYINYMLTYNEMRLRHEGGSEEVERNLRGVHTDLRALPEERRYRTRTTVEKTSRDRFQMLMTGDTGSAQRADHIARPHLRAALLAADAMWLDPRSESVFAPDDDEPEEVHRKWIGGVAFTYLREAMKTPTSVAVAKATADLRAAVDGDEYLPASRDKLLEDREAYDRALFEVIGTSGEASERRAMLSYQLELTDMLLDGVEADLDRSMPTYLPTLRQDPALADSLNRLLKQDEAGLMIVPGPNGTHVFSISKDDFDWVRSDMTVDEVDAAVAELRAGLSVDETGQLGYFDMALAHELYARLIEPVAGVFEGKTHIYVAAIGSLTTLPPGVLLTEAPEDGADYFDPEVLRNAAWLADKYALVQLPNLQTLDLLRGTGSRLRRRIKEQQGDRGGNPIYSGFGDPLLSGEAALRGVGGAVLRAFDPSSFIGGGEGSSLRGTINPKLVRAMPRLPGTRREVEAVRGGLGQSAELVFYDKAMTETQIKATDFTGVEILHLATHGVTAAQSRELAEPGLIFTPPQKPTLIDDGYLSAAEVIGLDLSSVRWVILSACNTAAPSGRPGEGGFSGLVKSFFLAGASTLLVSHWPVYDEVAAELGERTVRLEGTGMTRAMALQESMRQIRLDPSFDASHPAVWAPFALVGEGQ